MSGRKNLVMFFVFFPPCLQDILKLIQWFQIMDPKNMDPKNAKFFFLILFNNHSIFIIHNFMTTIHIIQENICYTVLIWHEPQS